MSLDSLLTPFALADDWILEQHQAVASFLERKTHIPRAAQQGLATVVGMTTAAGVAFFMGSVDYLQSYHPHMIRDYSAGIAAAGGIASMALNLYDIFNTALTPQVAEGVHEPATGFMGRIRKATRLTTYVSSAVFLGYVALDMITGSAYGAAQNGVHAGLITMALLTASGLYLGDDSTPPERGKRFKNALGWVKSKFTKEPEAVPDYAPIVYATYVPQAA